MSAESVPFKRKYDDVFTTGEVSKFCKVSMRTVCKWFDSGELGGYRLPNGQDRRIPRKALLQFLKSKGLPLGELEAEEQVRILTVGVHFKLRRDLGILLPADHGYVFESADGIFTAGAAFFRFSPNVVVVDAAIGSEEACSIARNVKDYEVDFANAGNAERSLRIVLAGEDYDVDDYPDYHEVYRQEVDPNVLVRRIAYFRNGAPARVKY